MSELDAGGIGARWKKGAGRQARGVNERGNREARRVGVGLWWRRARAKEVGHDWRGGGGVRGGGKSISDFFFKKKG